MTLRGTGGNGLQAGLATDSATLAVRLHRVVANKRSARRPDSDLSQRGSDWSRQIMSLSERVRRRDERQRYGHSMQKARPRSCAHARSKSFRLLHLSTPRFEKRANNKTKGVFFESSLLRINQRPEVREFIEDTRPKTNTTRGGRKAHRPTLARSERIYAILVFSSLVATRGRDCVRFASGAHTKRPVAARCRHWSQPT